MKKYEQEKKEKEEKEKAPLISELKGCHKLGNVGGVAYRMGGSVRLNRSNGPFHTAAIIFPFSTEHAEACINEPLK